MSNFFGVNLIFVNCSLVRFRKGFRYKSTLKSQTFYRYSDIFQFIFQLAFGN